MANATARKRHEEPIPEPEPVHIRRRHSSQTQTDADSNDEYEATELQDASVMGERAGPTSRVLNPPQPREPYWHDPFKKFWRHHVRVTVPHVDCRDHLANERTFLGYLRTSLALSFIGVVIAQLYRLQHVESPDPVFGYFVLSKPLAGIFQASALCVALLGAHRFWRQQTAFALGRAVAGGWELMACGGLVFVLLLFMFVLHIAVDVYKEQHGET